MKQNLPDHLKKYIVDQDYSKYTPLDQAVWRYCLRQLKNFLSRHGHPCYLEGLEKTGISIETIPRIEEISARLEQFGWIALPVSGFIPPAAFMELQSLGVLPIASDMRTIDHLLYTPAPDIVHEAAGHAPIIIDKEYATYLKQYSQVAKKAIISKEDLDLYEAIRQLSDVKENRESTLKDITETEQRLTKTIQNITHTSEASQLSRMNWWTAEYGLIGDLKNPKIFGAGLLSSVGESRWCLSENVKKIPISLDCINHNYDITEPQPQLFVTPDFKTLVKVLNQFSETMSYKLGGTRALEKLVLAKSVNTIELETGFQVSGVLDSYITDTSNEIIFFKCSGPTQISIHDRQIEGHGTDYHQHGYSTPLGKFKASSLGLNEKVVFTYASGIIVTGQLKKISQIEAEATIYTFENATMIYKDQTFFRPEWGLLDIITGSNIISAYGGAADREKFGETVDFVAAKVPTPKYNELQMQTFSLYQKIRNLRDAKPSQEQIENLFTECLKKGAHDWLLFIEILELSVQNNFPTVEAAIEAHLQKLMLTRSEFKAVIDDGIRLAHA